MLSFWRFGSLVAAMAAGLALLGAFGGCGPASGTCSSDNHQVLDPNNSSNVLATCPATQACAATTTANAGGCAVCDPTQCLANNACIQGWVNYDDAVKNNMANQTTECRLKCAQPSDCPFNYHCFDPSPGGANDQPYCVKDRTAYKATAMGEGAAAAPWGAPCSPQHGNPNPFAQNMDCDTSSAQPNPFWCYGISPTDANSFCTQFQCNDDGDCPGGWWCATINDSPNVTQAKRGFNIGQTYGWGSTTSVCLPRAYSLTPGTYCANCKSDVDCPSNGGNKQHCTAADGMSSTELVCAVECTANANCPDDYGCVDPGTGTKVCLPHAQTCKGSGAFCDPCHSDNDCTTNMGYCARADYSTEHFCTAATPTCATATTGMCPTLPNLAKPPATTTDGVGCTVDSSSGLPTKQCYAAGPFGLGCYTYHCVTTGNSACFQNSDCCSNKCNTSMNLCN